MRMKSILLAAALLAGATLAASAAQPKYTVHIRNFAFSPATLKVHAGDSVTFVNDDDEAHTVTATNKSFDSAGLDSKQSWTVTLRKLGAYTYFCALHPYMKGSIVVTSGKTP